MRSLLILTLFGLLATPLCAREELVTLPKRDSVQLTIYNSVDLTLVSERRTLAFKKGTNRLSFSWANTLIDPSSVMFRATDKPDQLDVVDTSFPGESDQMLVWNVNADSAGDYSVEISYFTSGISWAAEYVGVLNQGSSAMALTSKVKISNRSGEEYENATVRMVLGTIHLVEDISEISVSEKVRKIAHKNMRMAAEYAETRTSDKKEIVKQGLSEYYIYTVEGTETIPNGWSKSLESFHKDEVPVEFVYTYDQAKYGSGLRRVYSFANDAKHELGEEPLPEGSIRLYQDQGNGGLGYVAALWTKYIPKGEEVKIAGDTDPNVTLEITRMNYKRERLSFRSNEDREWLSGWDDVESYVVTVRNFHDRAIKAEIVLYFSGDFDVVAGDGTTFEKNSSSARKLKLDLGGGKTSSSRYTVTTRQGDNVN